LIPDHSKQPWYYLFGKNFWIFSTKIPKNGINIASACNRYLISTCLKKKDRNNTIKTGNETRKAAFFSFLAAVNAKKARIISNSPLPRNKTKNRVLLLFDCPGGASVLKKLLKTDLAGEITKKWKGLCLMKFLLSS
jgi:hypothetical protein